VSPVYKRTFFDQLGPDAAARFRTGAFAGAMSLLGAVFGAAIGIQRGQSILLSALGGAVFAGSLVYFLVRKIPHGAGAAMQAALMPSGDSTPYETDFSFEQALAMKGDVKGALAAFEEKIAAAPGDAAVRLTAAEMYMSNNNPMRARDLFREVQRLPTVQRRDDVTASYRLVDLYRGKLADPGRALPEFRRLIDRYPGTQIEAQARAALAKLKAELPVEG
jgi:hypothetical protein